MLVNKRKTRLFAFSSIVCRQADPPRRTRRALGIWPLSALERLENHQGFQRISACSEAKSPVQNGII